MYKLNLIYSCHGQVDFGAHKVVLVRDRTSSERLSQELRQSDAVIMTVPQSKVVPGPPIVSYQYTCVWLLDHG